MLIETIITCTVSVISIGISFVLGRLEARQKRFIDIHRERYQNFYIPYIQRLYAGFLWEYPIQKMPLESRSVFFDLLTNNLQYLDKATQETYPAFYQAYLDLLEYEDGNTEYSFAPQAFEHSFWNTTSKILQEAQYLSHKLRLPDLSATISTKLNSCESQQQHM